MESSLLAYFKHIGLVKETGVKILWIVNYYDRYIFTFASFRKRAKKLETNFILTKQYLLVILPCHQPVLSYFFPTHLTLRAHTHNQNQITLSKTKYNPRQNELFNRKTMSGRKKRPQGYSSDNSVVDPKGGQMVKERVINRDRQLSTTGSVQVDDPSAIGALLLSEVKWKAACWEITYMREDSSEGPTYNGQVGLIRGERLTASPDQNEARQQKTTKVENNPPPPGRWEVTPTTALHNVVDYPENDEVFLLSKIILPNPTKSSDADRVELIAADSVFAALEWKSVDISRGQVIKEPRNILTQKHLSFQPAPKEWTGICVGAKIGIAVFRPFDIRPSNTGMSMTDETLLRLFGKKDSVCVLTGEITNLHNNSARTFEHSINTYRGCSGSIIFLLDNGQPTEDIASHQGKGIGVHVGGKPVTYRTSRRG